MTAAYRRTAKRRIRMSSRLALEFDRLAVRARGRTDGVYRTPTELVREVEFMLASTPSVEKTLLAAAYLQGVSEAAR
jgi:hypothetical protein